MLRTVRNVLSTLGLEGVTLRVTVVLGIIFHSCFDSLYWHHPKLRRISALFLQHPCVMRGSSLMGGGKWQPSQKRVRADGRCVSGRHRARAPLSYALQDVPSRRPCSMKCRSSPGLVARFPVAPAVPSIASNPGGTYPTVARTLDRGSGTSGEPVRARRRTRYSQGVPLQDRH